MPDTEVARQIARQLNGTNIAIPEEVVTPSLRQELEKLGVPFDEKAGTRKEARVDNTQFSYSRPYLRVDENKNGQTKGSVLNITPNREGGHRLDVKSVTALNQSFDHLHNITQGNERKGVVGKLAGRLDGDFAIPYSESQKSFT